MIFYDENLNVGILRGLGFVIYMRLSQDEKSDARSLL